MSRATISVVILGAALAAGCSMRAKAKPASTIPVTPKPAPVEIARAAEPPYSVPQTDVVLPRPQPVNPEALPPARPLAPVPEPQPNKAARVTPPSQTQTQREATVQQPPPQPPPARQRVRPVQSERDRRRMLNEIESRRRSTEDLLAKVRRRQTSDQERDTIERINGFLEQVKTALAKEDLQQAEALSNRALLLSQDLASERQ